AYAMRMMNEAYNARSFQTAKRQLLALVSWLEENGEDDAASSLREGLQETLTVLKLDLPLALTRSLSTTNAIENLMGTIRGVTRNVKRWRNSNTMVKRWVSLSLSTAQRKFRAIRGYKNMITLVTSLRRKLQLDNTPLAA